MNPQTPSSSSNEAVSLAELRALLNRDAAEEQDELERTWHLAGYAPKPTLEEQEVAHAVAAFKSALTTTARPAGKAPARGPVRRRRSSARRRVGLAGLTVFGAALAWFLLAPTSIVAPPGAPTTVSLADGSSVVLNNGATLRYRRGLWGRTRAVALTGEAYFDVASHSRPFVIQTFNATVEVLGTTFNVRAWPDAEAPETAVSITTGQVRFAPRHDPDTATTVTPGQMSRIVGDAAGPTPPAPFNTDLALLWLNGGFAFIERPLSALFIELERRFGINIEVMPSALTGDTLTWIQPRLQNAEAALIDVCSLSGCRFERTPDGFRIFQH